MLVYQRVNKKSGQLLNSPGSPWDVWGWHGMTITSTFQHPEVLQRNRFSSSKGLRVKGGSVNGRKFQALPGGYCWNMSKHVETIGRFEIPNSWESNWSILVRGFRMFQTLQLKRGNQWLHLARRSGNLSLYARCTMQAVALKDVHWWGWWNWGWFMALFFQHYILIHYVPSIGHRVSSASAYWLLLGAFTARAISGDIILLICQYFPCWWQKRRTIKIYKGLTSQKKWYAHQL